MKSTLLEAEKNLEAAVESLIAIGDCVATSRMIVWPPCQKSTRQRDS